ncbi:alpha/beta hydrolase [Bacillus sp. DTU_2020_1000418_1_SI_GHA_SEK_038]|uniref:alpha/beta fold hydrolase n=1 Tax=Bacillus sp. DTU_2020_1000418_1_SI_GHA_SEK_038 TaxID=3077585 RepID=UPI0028EBA5BC|nr:alpha/beta hydrolase [Bacillus sp. DTU_2020_1000418_1_SI_GHA_SEK_038]WNS75431.1 alpha/beta hydrolase [Bacillus sp. DTU_2020_1000418_1_SI_GHA_SEK_038]
MLIGIIGLAGLLLLGLVYEQVSRRRDGRRPHTGEMIDVGGYRLHLTDTGKGEPTVVLIHGAGDCSYSWVHIRKELSKFTRFITYGRAGMGSSDPGPEPTPEQTVKDLKNLLNKTGAPGPYVLVGHSLGGLIVRLYALKYPNQVAGLVFLDSTHEFLKDDAKFKQGFTFIGFMLKILRLVSPFGIPRFFGNVLGVIPMYGSELPYYKQQLDAEEYKQWKGIVYSIFAGKTAGAEFKGAWGHLEATANLLNNSMNKPQFGDLPIAVVNNPGFGAHWTEMQKELASRSTNSIHKISDRKGHSLQMPRPEYVIEAIRHVVEQVQERNGRTLAESYEEHKHELG